jgi:hypothetical protein
MGRQGVTQCGVNWSPAQQSFYFASERYVHRGPTNTNPSHDVAHVLVAATSSLKWLPLQSDVEIRLAEFNAVLCETWLDRVFHVVFTERIKPDDLVEGVIAHARWFVEQYYVPFPLGWHAACVQFLVGMNLDCLVRLSPVFFKQRWREIANGETDGNYRIRFMSGQEPATDKDMRACQTVIRKHWPAFASRLMLNRERNANSGEYSSEGET